MKKKPNSAVSPEKSSQYEEILEKSGKKDYYEKSKAKPNPGTLPKILFLIIIIIKSLSALAALGLMPVIFLFCNDLDTNLFGAFLLIVAIILLIISYCLSTVCICLNFFIFRRYGKFWTLISLISIVLVLPALAIGALTSAVQPLSTILLCICIGIQAVPSVSEIYRFEKNLAVKKLKKHG